MEIQEVKSLEETSSDESTQVVRRKVVREECKVILKFRKEDEHVNLSPIGLTRELKKKIGDVEMAEVL